LDSQVISKPTYGGSYTWNQEVRDRTRPKLGSSGAKWTVTNLRKEDSNENEWEKNEVLLSLLFESDYMSYLIVSSALGRQYL
jgi:hypothetical protein